MANKSNGPSDAALAAFYRQRSQALRDSHTTQSQGKTAMPSGVPGGDGNQKKDNRPWWVKASEALSRVGK